MLNTFLTKMELPWFGSQPSSCCFYVRLMHHLTLSANYKLNPLSNCEVSKCYHCTKSKNSVIYKALINVV